MGGMELFFLDGVLTFFYYEVLFSKIRKLGIILLGYIWL